MGEHKQPVNIGRKKRWDAQRGVDLKHHRFVWRSSEKGTFKYPSTAYGALKDRRTYKNIRKYLKRIGLRGKDRTEAMLNVMGVDE